MKKEHSPNFDAPITGQMLIPQQCKGCAFRMKKPYIDNGKEFDNGWSCGACIAYPVVKPDNVLKNKGKCVYYEKG